MIKLVGISGSLRKASFNGGLLRAAADLAPEGVAIVAASIRGVPLYDGDLEAGEGIPAAVAELKELAASADGLLLFTPEYNNAMPGVFKNAIDWMSRPGADIARIFGGKPVAVLGASPSGFGTVLAQNAWLPVLRVLGTDPWFGGRMAVSRAHTVFDAQGNLVDDGVKQQLRQFLSGFADFVRARTPGGA